VSALGTSYDLDVLIFATGFDATEPRYGPQVVGRDGLSLSDAWARGMRALDSTAVSGFPNLFIINGPNTGLGHNSIVYVVEAQVDYILGALRFAADNEIASLEATPDAEQEYVDRLRLRSAGTVWLDGGCKSWYVDPRSGELTIIWPDFAHSFRDDNAEFAPDRYQVVHT
jgi:cation diffusion facilitator CzcD-associated flavoprotein CzcO